MNKFKYLEHNRILDIITAIQFLGSFEKYKLSDEEWTKKIATHPISDAANWKTIFDEHPEFFRKGKRGYYSLVWRRSCAQLYNIDSAELVTRGQCNKMTEDEQNCLSRRPLESSEIADLIQSAIALQDSAFSRKKDKRWWITLLAPLLGVMIGALIPIFAAYLNNKDKVADRIEIRSAGGIEIHATQELESTQKIPVESSKD